MSFILDALQKADAERARGNVPSLHAHHVSNTFEPAGVAPRTKLMGAVVAAIAATGFASWLWLGNPPPTPVASAPAVATPAPAPLPAPLPMPAPSAPPVPQPQSVPPLAPAPHSASVAPPSQAATTPLATPKLAPSTKPPAATPVRAASSTKAAAPDTKATAKAAQPTTAPLLAELPEDIRRQIPAMAISGAVYSDNPAQRLLLVNGQVLTQGSQAAPDVTLVEIRPTSSVFNFRGTQFRLGH